MEKPHLKLGLNKNKDLFTALENMAISNNSVDVNFESKINNIKYGMINI